jgi:hypothetical protein
VLGPRGKPVLKSAENHHAIPHENGKYKHDKHPLVVKAEVDLASYPQNQKVVIGHKGPHNGDNSRYNREIQERLDNANTQQVKDGTPADAKKALDSVLSGIWDDIRSADLPLYTKRDVIV